MSPACLGLPNIRLITQARRDRPFEIVFLDPATGTHMVATEYRWWTGLPTACADDAQLLCAWTYYVELDNTLTRKEFRIDKVTGVITSIPGDKAVAPASDYTTLWNDVVKINNAPVETIGIVKGRKCCLVQAADRYRRTRRDSRSRLASRRGQRTDPGGRTLAGCR